MIDLRFDAVELAERRDRIVSFIRDTHDAAGSDGVVIGLSGGIDSSLTASLAVEALGPDEVYGVSMPASVSADRHRSDAERLAAQLEIRFDTVEIEPVVAACIASLSHDDVDTFARGNARARVRAVLSYLIANEENRLVLGTGNRTEALVGYFTKYGDGAVDCLPIGNLYKCQVRQLARDVGVPDDIVEKPPTAELWTDQTDEDELGIEYDTLDAILALHVDGSLPRSRTAELADCAVETVDRVVSMVQTSAHKRAVPPAPGDGVS